MDRQELEKLIQNLYVQTGAGEFFEPPTIHVASASDPFFTRYKTVIGPHHWTPQEALCRKFPEATARSVVVWVLPVSRKARETNRRETGAPLGRMAAVRSFGEIMNEEIRSQTAGLLTAAGFPAVAPHLEQREIYPGSRLGCEEFHLKLVGTACRFRRRGRHFRTLRRTDHRPRRRNAARLRGHGARIGPGRPPLRRRSVRVVHPVRSLHPPLSRPCDRQGIHRPRQARLRQLLRNPCESGPRGALRLAEPRSRLRPLPDCGAL